MKALQKARERYAASPASFKAATWFVACGLIQKGIGVVVTPIFTRLMDTEQYGMYTLYSSWLEILAVIITLRLSWGVFMQGIIRYDYDADEYTSSLQGLTTLLVMSALAVYYPFREFWNGLTGLNTFLMTCALVNIWSSAMFGFWSTRQRIANNYKLLVAVTLSVALITPISSILAVVSVEACKVEARVACITAVDFAFYSVMFCYYMAKGRKFFDGGHWRHALGFNLPLIPHYLSQSVLHQADRVMLSSMCGMSAAGIYGLAYSIANIMSVVNQSIMKAFDPWLFRQIREGNSPAIARASYAAIAVVGSANLILVAFAPEVIWLFAPEPYWDAKWVIPPLAGSMFLAFMYNLFADFEMYYEKTQWVAVASVAAALVNIVLNVALIPEFGFVAAGYTTLASYALYIWLHYCFMRRVQKAEMGGVRVYDPKVLVGLFGVFALLVTLLTMAYPILLARMLCVAAMSVIAIWRRRRLVGLLQQVRG